MSLQKILKCNGPNVELWGILCVNLNQSLYEDPTLALCIQLAK